MCVRAAGDAPLIASAEKELVPQTESYTDIDDLPATDQPTLEFLPWNQIPNATKSNAPPATNITGHALIDGNDHDAATRALNEAERI